MNFSHWFLLFWALVVLYNFSGIWLIQLVVYPLFGKVGPDEYIAYHSSTAAEYRFPSSSRGSPASSCP